MKVSIVEASAPLLAAIKVPPLILTAPEKVEVFPLTDLKVPFAIVKEVQLNAAPIPLKSKVAAAEVPVIEIPLAPIVIANPDVPLIVDA